MSRTVRCFQSTIALLASAFAIGGAPAHTTLPSIPLYFEENHGQADPRVRFLARSDSAGVTFIGQDGAVALHSGQDRLSFRILGAAPSPRLVAEQPQPGVSNYYLGQRAITGAPHYAKVRIRQIRPGLDVVFYGQANRIEYDLLFSPGSNPAALRLRFEGGQPPFVSENGDLIIRSGTTEFRQFKPVAWQNTENGRRDVKAGYAVTASGDVRLTLGRFNPSLPLIVDPILSYSTFLGGALSDVPAAIAADSSGSAYITGQATSTGFPVTSGSLNGGSDVFVTKLSPDGRSLVYSTFIGGSSGEWGKGIAVDAQGNAFVAGATTSTDFPSSGYKGGEADAFVLKLGPSGTLAWSTLIGGTAADSAAGIAIDAAGNSYIAGNTNSGSIASSGAFQSAFAGWQDGFVAKLSPTGSLSYLTYLGGSALETANAIAVDSAGNAYVAGHTESSDFPLTPTALISSRPGLGDAFVTALNPTGTDLLYSSFLGGRGFDTAASIAIDPAGDVYVAGHTASDDFPIQPGSYMTIKPPSLGLMYTTAGFISKFKPSQDRQVWTPGFSTYLGASPSTTITSIAVNSSGQVFATGYTDSTSFPVTPGALKTAMPSVPFEGTEVFVTQLSANGDSLAYSTRFGRYVHQDQAHGIALDGNGGVYICGATMVSTFPTTPGSYQPNSPKTPASTLSTPFVAKIDMSSPVACTPQLSSTGATVAGKGGSAGFSMTLSAGCPWEALADPFIQLNGAAAGMGSESPIHFDLTIPPNPSASTPRTGKVSIGSAEFTITQPPWECSAAIVAPVSLGFTPAGGSRTLALNLPANCEWLATLSGEPWLQITGNSHGTGPATITVNASPNAFSSRTAAIYVAGQSIPITQSGDGCSMTATASPATFGPGGGAGTIRIVTPSNCAWTTDALAPWLQVTPGYASGQGNATIPFRVAANPGVVSRAASFWIGGQTVTITQSSGTPAGVNGYTESLVAGSGSLLGDGGPAVAAALNQPGGLLLDSTGLYIADRSHNRIRQVTPDGLIRTSAGGGTSQEENVDRFEAFINNPYAIAPGSEPGIYYFTESSRVRKIAGQQIAPFAGTGQDGFSGDGGPAISARLYPISGLATDASGDLYIADWGNERVRKVSGDVITTFAGGGSALNDGGAPTLARLKPGGIAVDATGALYITDTLNKRIRKVASGVIRTIAGGGASTADGALAVESSIDPSGPIAVDPSGSVYFAQINAIKKIDTDGRIRTISPGSSYAVGGLVADASANVYFSDYQANVVRKLTPTPSYCAFTVSAPDSISAAGGSISMSVNTSSQCGWTAALDPSISWITVNAGQGSGSGTATITVAANTAATRSATVFVAGQPITISQTAAGTGGLFVELDTTTQGSWIGKYGSDGYHVVEHGMLAPAYVSPLITGSSRHIWSGVTTDPRALQIPTSTTERLAAAMYAATSFTVDLPFTGGIPRRFAVYCLDWDRLGRSQKLEILDTAGNVLDVRTLSNFGNGVYAVWNVSAPVRLRVTRIAGPNAVVSGMFFGGAGSAPFGVGVSPFSVSLHANQTQQFSAVVSAPSWDVTWSINPNIGSISLNGLYTAPSLIATQQIVTVIATSKIDNQTKGSASVTLLGSTTPGGGTAQFYRPDPATQGNWKSVFGGEGYVTPGGPASNPFYVTPVVSGASTHTWASGVSDIRALQPPSGSARTASVWYSSSSITVDLPVSGGARELAVYFLDWDRLGREQRVEMLDTNNNVLDARNVSGFGEGLWLVWSVSGHVKLRVTRTAGVNAVLSGLFFGNAAPLPVFVSVSPVSATVYAGQTRTFTATVAFAQNTAVTWSISPSLGTIDSAGLYTAPSSIASAQTVTVTATSQADPTKSATAAVTVQPSSPAPASATFVAQHSFMGGTWEGRYGAEGYNVIGASSSNPSYVTPVASGHAVHVWAANTNETRALVKPGGVGRIAGVWYAPDRFVVDLPFSDSHLHQMAVYCLDWDRLNRSQSLEILNGSDTVLDARQCGNFGEGAWVVWNVQGHVKLRVTRISGVNAVISGLFFGPADVQPVSVSVGPSTAALFAGQSQGFTATVANATNTSVLWSISPNVGTITSAGVYTAPASVTTVQTITVKATSVADASKFASAAVTLMPPGSGSSAADFVAQDTSTRGAWRAVYGSEGFNVAGDGAVNPSYVTPAAMGAATHVWQTNTADTRALQRVTGDSRVAGVWYAADSFVWNLPFSDTATHQVSIYCLDWDNLGRSQKVEVLDAAGNVLDTRNISNFGGGVWLVWNVRGPAKLRITRTSGLNAVASGLFFK